MSTRTSRLASRVVWLWVVSAGVAAIALAQGNRALAQKRAARRRSTLSVTTPAPSAPDDTSLLDSTLAQNELIAAVIKSDVEKQLRDAQSQMAGDPEGVEKALKVTLGRVLRAPELNSELRAQLRGQIAAALRGKRIVGRPKSSSATSKSSKHAPPLRNACGSPRPWSATRKRSSS